MPTLNPQLKLKKTDKVSETVPLEQQIKPMKNSRMLIFLGETVSFVNFGEVPSLGPFHEGSGFVDSHTRTSKQCSHCSRKKTDFGGLHSHWSTARHLARSCTSASHYAQELTLASGFRRTFEPSCLPKSLARGHPTLGGRSPWNTNFQNLHLQRSRPAIISSHSHLPIYICTVATLHCWWFEDSEASIFSIGSRLNLGTCDSSRGQRVSESFGRCGLIEVTRTMPGRGSWCKRGFFQGSASTGLGVQSSLGM